jgi:hypothetical protein
VELLDKIPNIFFAPSFDPTSASPCTILRGPGAVVAQDERADIMQPTRVQFVVRDLMLNSSPPLSHSAASHACRSSALLCTLHSEQLDFHGDGSYLDYRLPY